jgi:hypothetical protein
MPESKYAVKKLIVDDLPNAKVFMSDGSYATPTESWIASKCYWQFETNLRKNDLYKWRAYHDCDNKAFSFWQFVCDCHCKTMMDREKRDLPVFQGVTVGVIFYIIDGSSGHAINILVNKTGVKYFEPQTGKFVTLTKTEKNSAWFIIL